MISTDWRYRDVIFEHVFQNAFPYRCFFNIGYRQICRYKHIGKHIGKHVERNIKNTFYICKIFVERRPKDGWKMSLGDACIMMFYGRPENVSLTHSTRFITTILLKYIFIETHGNKNNWVYPMSHKFRRDVLISS